MSALTIRCGSSKPSLTGSILCGRVRPRFAEGDGPSRLRSRRSPEAVYLWLPEPGAFERRLEAETHRNIEVIWLLRHLKPDFKTIADFRRDNRAAFRQAFREFVLLCRQLDLFGGNCWRWTARGSSGQQQGPQLHARRVDQVHPRGGREAGRLYRAA